jgi:hypothetical protein
VRSRRALTSPEPPAASWPSTEWLKGLRGFRVEWDDGVFGKVEGIAFFVRTVGFGTARQKLELLPLDEVAAILPEEPGWMDAGGRLRLIGQQNMQICTTFTGRRDSNSRPPA